MYLYTALNCELWYSPLNSVLINAEFKYSKKQHGLTLTNQFLQTRVNLLKISAIKVIKNLCTYLPPTLLFLSYVSGVTEAKTAANSLEECCV